ncbi:hypothetical protein QUV96_00880 [Amedibacillus dolichus]|uniref:ATP-binding protein n=1 Tax=Amedibacillus dolichus TaxID=31971 RepID=A0ABT7U970_9FIRM|nr:hypothetical protein [Amedibacillus dolichus]MDM8156186.1 hypothetical protein [Amedibacillus dolichus]
MKKNTSAKMIKKAIDSYPGGICFFALDGRVILVNEKMNQLALELTGHTILNAKATWEKLTNFANNGKAEKLTQSWLPKDTDKANGSPRQQLFFRFSNSSVWRFELRFLDSNTVQVEAAEITELYQLSEELYENTIRLRQTQKRQKALLDSIVEVNLNKEILAAKMHIHDELGHCLLATTKAITEDSLAENADVLRESWNSTIRDFTNIPTVWTVPDSSLQSELMQVAELIGCKVIFLGEQPKSRKALQLLYAAIREALTNSVRHVNATELMIKIEQDEKSYHIEISDNGSVSVSSITEGNGLSALRQRLEQEGASLKVLCDNSVSLIIDIPFDLDESQKGGRK